MSSNQESYRVETYLNSLTVPLGKYPVEWIGDLLTTMKESSNTSDSPWITSAVNNFVMGLKMIEVAEDGYQETEQSLFYNPELEDVKMEKCCRGYAKVTEKLDDSLKLQFFNNVQLVINTCASGHDCREFTVAFNLLWEALVLFDLGYQSNGESTVDDVSFIGHEAFVKDIGEVKRDSESFFDQVRVVFRDIGDQVQDLLAQKKQQDHPNFTSGWNKLLDAKNWLANGIRLK